MTTFINISDYFVINNGGGQYDLISKADSQSMEFQDENDPEIRACIADAIDCAMGRELIEEIAHGQWGANLEDGTRVILFDSIAFLEGGRKHFCADYSVELAALTVKKHA